MEQLNGIPFTQAPSFLQDQVRYDVDIWKVVRFGVDVPLSLREIIYFNPKDDISWEQMNAWLEKMYPNTCFSWRGWKHNKDGVPQLVVLYKRKE
jgi:hypothetical protein